MVTKKIFGEPIKIKQAFMLRDYNEVEDFLSDDSFLNWYFRSDETDTNNWENWMTSNPDKKSLINEAVKFLNELKLNEKEIPFFQIDAAHTRFLNRINEVKQYSRPAVTPSIRRRWWLAAASVAAIFICFYLWKDVSSVRPAFQTQYGEIKQQQLPDGSEIVLNANSKISYASQWEKGQSREVWIKGEVFFQVRKTAEKSKFIVHTDKFDIVVTGTQFNVVNKQGKSNVLLKEGSITIITKDGKSISMKAGDYYEYVQADVIKREVKTESILAWKDNKIDFDNITLNDAATLIKEHYGVDVKITDVSLAKKQLNGIMANDNLDVLLNAIKEALEVQVIKNENEVVIKP